MLISYMFYIFIYIYNKLNEPKSSLFQTKMADQSSYPLFFLPSQCSSSDSDSSISTKSEIEILKPTVIDLVSLSTEEECSSICSSIDSPSPFYKSDLHTHTRYVLTSIYEVISICHCFNYILINLSLFL